MTITPSYRSAMLSAVLSLLALVTTVHAELGGTTAATTATTASTATSAAPGTGPLSLPNGAVRVRRSVDAGGTTINEYASTSGQIFA
jgi:hypothetical protein